MEENVEKALQAASEIYLDHICAAATAADLACERLLEKSNNPWKGIVETAQTKKCDLIIMGAHGRTWAHMDGVDCQPSCWEVWPIKY